MTAEVKDILVEQGATFTFGFIYCAVALDGNGDPILDENGKPVAGEPHDLTGCTARLQIRQRMNSATPLVTATSGPDPAAGGGRIILQAGGAMGRVDVVLTDLDTDALNIKRAIYDLELEWPPVVGELRPRVERILQGAVTVNLNVTREGA
ncbi:MAG: hypothetical protein HOV97_04915 [Nonomuraea sp.]|nr:hypothetical protein [Nonomuraea sp.]